MYDHYRRIFTDGRNWPTQIEPTFAGYSIRRWVDQDRDGRYATLERAVSRGPRAYDEAGLPSISTTNRSSKERIYRDKADANIIHDEITTIDHALTRSWTVDKRYMRDPDSRPVWPEYYIAEGNRQIAIGNEN